MYPSAPFCVTVIVLVRFVSSEAVTTTVPSLSPLSVFSLADIETLFPFLLAESQSDPFVTSTDQPVFSTVTVTSLLELLESRVIEVLSTDSVGFVCSGVGLGSSSSSSPPPQDINPKLSIAAITKASMLQK